VSFVLPAEIVLASGNQGKLKELSELLSDCPNTLRLQSEFGVEPADEPACTFIENALLKARHAAARTGLAALADDSGLSVDALGGAPGVRSARYAGEPSDDARNRARLIEDLAGVAPDERGAAFHCTIVLLRHADDPIPIVAGGVWRGMIAQAARGNGGFGYDPVFIANETPGRTAAELTKQEKNALSHRARAIAALRTLLTA